jgi:penicillin amidase
MRTLFVKFLILIILPIAFVVGYIFFTSDFGLPQVQGVINVKGISGDISISRDEYGTVYIKADNDNDVFFGMGMAHGQDRLWQLELQRRLSQGRLSEIFGKNFIKIDAQMRTLGLYESVQSAWDALSPEAKSSLTAYSAGINARLNNSNALPLEFNLFDIQPEPWTEYDSLAWSKVFALNLSNSMLKEITRFIAKSHLSGSQDEELFGEDPNNYPIKTSYTDSKVFEALTAMTQLQDEFQQKLNIGGEFVGSNAWAISGKLTNSGNSILANDPHLGIQMPSIWYMANLSGEHLNASGMSIVGLPVIIFGRNDKISWGGTNMMTDVQDLYFEQVNGSNPKQYLDKGQWRDFEIKKHYIKVRPEFPEILREPIKPVEVIVRKTVRGPILSDIFGFTGQPVSLRWTGLDEGDTTYESFFRLNYTNDWSSFKSALSYHVAPTLNILYTDQLGNIGYMGAGLIPIRSKGKGLTPVPGGTSDYQWTGYIPFEDWPQSYNPEKGYIVSANNKMVDDDYPYFISSDWAPDARAKRIEQLIQEGLKTTGTLSLGYMRKIQGDTLSYGATGLITLLKSASMETEKQRLAQNYLSKWDGDMAEDSQSASIFYSWARHLRIILFRDNLSTSLGNHHQSTLINQFYMSTTYDQIEAALTPGGALWCDDINTSTVENCEWVIQQSLDLAIKELYKVAGSDMDDWTWGDVHKAVYSHNPFSEVNLLKPLFESRISNGGGPNTINVASATFVESEGYEQHFGAGFRQIIELGNNSVNHVYMNSTGQSDNVLSKHYDDMVEPFRDVLYIDLNKSKIETVLVLKKLRQ